MKDLQHLITESNVKQLKEKNEELEKELTSLKNKSIMENNNFESSPKVCYDSDLQQAYQTFATAGSQTFEDANKFFTFSKDKNIEE